MIPYKMFRRMPFYVGMAALLIIVFSVILTAALDSDKTLALSDEKRLIKHLLEHYKKVGIVGRPVYNTSETVHVSYGLALIQILDLDEKNQVLTTNVWSRYMWNDILLMWDPDDFGGVKEVRVPPGKIWTPDIMLYNYADTRLEEKREAMAVINFDGTVMWIPLAIFKSTCSIDITHFPFDYQTCKMKFGSWTYDGFKLDVDFYDGLSSIDITDYIKSNEWGLVGHPAIKNVKYYPCCKEPYPDLTFVLQLKRIAAFYNYILILPCVLLSSLTLVIFWLPPESPAKMMLGMNIFVAFFVLLLLLADSTPQAASSIPLIGAYFCLNMILITLSTFLSVIVINLYFRGDRKNKVPKWLHCIMVDGLARVMCMRGEIKATENKPEQPHNNPAISSDRSPNARHYHSNSKDRKKIKPPKLEYNKFQPPAYDFRDTITSANTNRSAGGGSQVVSYGGHHQPSHHHNHPTTQQQLPPSDMSPLHSQAMENDVKEIKRILKTFMNRLSEKDAQGKIAKEWRIVARILDRLFFFLYVITIIVSLATIFPKDRGVESSITKPTPIPQTT